MRRNIKNLDDARQALKELQDEVDSLTIRNVDFHQRRIINAHPSIDDYDYVVRKELRQGIENITVNRIGGTGTGTTALDQSVWFEAILPGVRSIANDVMDNRLRIGIDDNLKLVLKRCYATVKTTPPSGADYVADILRSTDSSVTFSTIFAGSSAANRIRILASGHRGEQDTFAITELYNNDELRLDEITTGSAVGIDIAILCKLVKK